MTCKCYDKFCNSHCCKAIKKIPPKRFFLPLVGIFALFIFEEVRNFFYVPLVVFFGFFVIFWNFPKFLYFTNSKPMYFEDLFIDKRKLPNYDVNIKIKKKFLNIFQWTLIITNSLLISALSDYWLYKTTDSNNYLEILGVTGGILKIFQLINNIIGGLLLKIIRRFIVDESIQMQLDRINKIKKVIRLRQIQKNLLDNIDSNIESSNSSDSLLPTYSSSKDFEMIQINKKIDI